MNSYTRHPWQGTLCVQWKMVTIRHGYFKQESQFVECQHSRNFQACIQRLQRGDSALCFKSLELTFTFLNLRLDKKERAGRGIYSLLFFVQITLIFWCVNSGVQIFPRTILEHFSCLILILRQANVPEIRTIPEDSHAFIVISP